MVHSLGRLKIKIMHNVKITAIRKADYKDLQALYENPIQHACTINEGDSWISINAT